MTSNSFLLILFLLLYDFQPQEKCLLVTRFGGSGEGWGWQIHLSHHVILGPLVQWGN